MLIGISGVTYDKNGNYCSVASGKSTVANRLVDKHNFVEVALGDPIKRICREVFDFTDEQLWGTPDAKNAPDKRYLRSVVYKGPPRPIGKTGFLAQEIIPNSDVYLTPRYAMQRLGTEWGRDCYQNVWTNYALKVARGLLKNEFCYDPKRGLVTMGGTTIEKRKAKGVVISDVRFVNEFDAIRSAGGKLWRIKHPVNEVPENLREGHPSETELLSIPDDKFDVVLPNERDIDHLYFLVDAVMQSEFARMDSKK